MATLQPQRKGNILAVKRITFIPQTFKMIKYNFINQVGGGLALRRGREIGQRKDFLPTASLFIFQKQE